MIAVGWFIVMDRAQTSMTDATHGPLRLEPGPHLPTVVTVLVSRVGLATLVMFQSK